MKPKMAFGIGEMTGDPKDNMRRVMISIDSEEILLSIDRYPWRIASQRADELRGRFNKILSPSEPE